MGGWGGAGWLTGANTRTPPHPPLRLIFSQNYLVHDGEEEARMGDFVRIQACRPLSKHKKFTLSEVLKRKNIAEEFLEKEEVELASS